MKIEVGKYYRTRSGKKAFAGCSNPLPGRCEYPLSGYIEGQNSCASWSTSGKFHVLTGAHEFDLVSEWGKSLTLTVTGDITPDELVVNGTRFVRAT